MNRALVTAGLLLGVFARSEAATFCNSDNRLCLYEVDSTPLANRIPLILIHGWNPASTPGPPLEAVWENFASYYARHPDLPHRTKPYLVSYASNVVPLLTLEGDLRDVIDMASVADTAGFGNKPLVFVAHSMGGLLGRTFMALPSSHGPAAGQPGAARTLRLITLGTPHHGSVLANGPAMRHKAGLAWQPVIDSFENLLFLLNGPLWNEVNRSDLWWDNFDGLLDLVPFPSEQNQLLTILNASTAHDPRIVAYGGRFIPPAACGVDSYCWGARILSGAFDLGSDGVVPMSSAFLHDNGGVARVTTRYCDGCNHNEIATGRGDDLLFDSIAADILAVLPIAPGKPTVSAAVTGAIVSASWAAGPGGAPESYSVSVGTTPGTSNVFAQNVGLATAASGAMPPGIYFLRVVAINAAGSASSDEIRIDVGGVVPPGAPTLTSAIAGNLVTLNWIPGAGGAPASYFLSVGTTPGSSDVFAQNLGLTTSGSGTLPAGNYYARVTAINPAGAATSNEVTMAIGGGCALLPPTNLTGHVSGSTVSLAWSAPEGCAPTRYLIEAGTLQGLSNVASLEPAVPITSLTQSNVPTGTYYIRVKARYPSGLSGPSNEIVLTVGTVGPLPDLAGEWIGTYFIFNALSGNDGQLTFELTQNGTKISGNWSIRGDLILGSVDGTLSGDITPFDINLLLVAPATQVGLGCPISVYLAMRQPELPTNNRWQGSFVGPGNLCGSVPAGGVELRRP